MNSITSTFSKSLMAIFILTLSTSSFAEGKRRGGAKRVGKILKQLELTQEQKEQFKKFRQETKTNRKSKREEIKSLRAEMKKSFQSDASESSLRSLHEKLKNLRSQMADFRFNKMIKIRSILTTEQRAKFNQLRAEQKQSR
jgi:Spy/CpxP family protein refolding chaperone